jgi:hypothetical protein
VLVIGSGDAAPTDMLAIAGAENSTYYFGTGLYQGAPDTPKLAQTIIDRIYSQYGERSIHCQAVNVLYMMKQAMEKAGSLDTKEVRDAWGKMATMETPYGTAHQGGFTDIRHQAGPMLIRIRYGNCQTVNPSLVPGSISELCPNRLYSLL